MGKPKAKRRGLSESASAKGAMPKKTLNPFEIHVNRQKFNVIGRKLKSERGLPGISRSRAMAKRKATLLQEYKVKDKSNKFFDRRIGEKDREMTNEDKVIARFTAERMKSFKKKQIFNLAEDEVLTHRGQTLSEIEKFEDFHSDDDEDVNDTGKLGASFVEDAHFGGGPEDRDKKSRKDLIAQLIAESKKRKAEKQNIREQTLDLTEKLDTEWHDLLPIVASSKKKPTDPVEVEKPDSYDVMMRELKFEARVKASDPLKTEQEIQEEERKKRAELEAEREKRMFGGEENEQLYKHRSADDLDDGFAIDVEPEVTLTYDLEGNIMLRELESTEMEEESSRSANQLDKVNENQEDSNDGGSNNDDEEEENSGSEDDNDDDDEETDDSLSDLRPSSGNESSAEDVKDNQMSQKDQKEAKQEREEQTERIKIEDSVETMNNKLAGERLLIVANLLTEKDKSVFLQSVKIKFPNFSSVPETYEALHKILKCYNAEEQGVIIDHIMKKNHISLNEVNRSRLETLFQFLLQHIDHSASQDAGQGLKVLNYLAPSLYDLTHMSPECVSRSVLEIIKEKQQAFQNRQQKYPTFNSLIFFKVVSLLFPTSDFQHPVVSPSVVFMCQMLFQCRVKSRRDISAGLFLVTMVLEFTVLSKRFSPAAINFLCGVLHLAIPKRLVQVASVLPIPPFRRVGEYSDLLLLEDKVEDVDAPFQMKVADLSEETIDTSFKIRALASAVAMLGEFVSNLSYLQASPNMFYRASVLLSKVPIHHYPTKVQTEIEKLSLAFQKLKEKTLQFLVVERKRPKALRLYEPKIETVCDGRRIRPMGPEKMERERLLHKIKREKKAALREIRRDNAFLSKLKFKETIQSDKERFQKVKEIFGSAASQLGEIRALERKKNRLKK
ncbi:hypothetical protein R5R35_009132 [Gryllus longicercus]|uniref:Nucleolar protein 14 n=1 Tax=Gryllus longicercus TaxID=2509291 RepID=A0AAN9VVK9_9ORTH